MGNQTEEYYVRVDQLLLGLRLLTILFGFLALAATVALLAISVFSGGPPFLQKGTIFLNFATAWSLPGVGLVAIVVAMVIFDSIVTTFFALVYMAPATAFALYQVASAAYAYFNVPTGLLELTAVIITFVTAAAMAVTLGLMAVLYRDQTKLGWGPLVTATEAARRRQGGMSRDDEDDTKAVELESRGPDIVGAYRRVKM